MSRAISYSFHIMWTLRLQRYVGTRRVRSRSEISLGKRYVPADDATTNSPTQVE